MIRSLRACAELPRVRSPSPRLRCFSYELLSFQGSLSLLLPLRALFRYQFSDFPVRLSHSLRSLLAGPRAGLPQLRAGAVGRSRAPLGPLSHSLAGLLNDHSVTPGFSGPGGRRQKGENQACPCRAALAGKAPFNGKARRKPGLVPCLPVQSWLVGPQGATPA